MSLVLKLGLEPKVAWGIAAGIATFVTTVVTVIVLLVAGGSFERLKEELSGSVPPVIEPSRPRLRDDLLETSARLKKKPDNISSIQIVLRKPGTETKSRGLVKTLVLQTCTADDAQKSWDGRPRWGLTEAYDPSTIWHDMPSTQDASLIIGIYHDDEIIGVMSLCDHRPIHLSIRFNFLWLHPAYLDQNRSLASVASCALLDHLFQQNYRRIEFIFDDLDPHRQRLALSLAFHREGILRKHMIVRERNRDSAVFSILNSDWFLGHRENIFKRLQIAASSSSSSNSTRNPSSQHLPDTLQGVNEVPSYTTADLPSGDQTDENATVMSTNTT